jgi:hypothetical protein
MPDASTWWKGPRSPSHETTCGGVHDCAPKSVPVTRYAKSGGVNIDYQVVGTGPLDLVVVPGWISHLELGWEDPRNARLLRRLASLPIAEDLRRLDRWASEQSRASLEPRFWAAH